MSYCTICLVPLPVGLHILLVVKKTNKMAERFAKVNQHEIRELLVSTTYTKNTVFVYIIK